MATGDISWAAHGVFDPRRLVGSTDADASPRFHSIALTGTVAEDIPQAKLDELAGEAWGACVCTEHGWLALQGAAWWRMRMHRRGS